MVAKCPNHPEHKEFITCAHVMQDWKVDAHENFVDIVDASVQTTHGPHPENSWTCAICAVETVVTEN